MMRLQLIILGICTWVACDSPITPETLKIEKVVIDSIDSDYGYYLAVKPKGEIQKVLVLLPGFGQKAEDVFLDTEFHKHALEKNILTIAFAGRTRLTADSTMRFKLNDVFHDVMANASVDKDKFVLGGFSAGGTIALRYTELCHQYPDIYPIKPKGVFMVDSPIDLYHSWQLQVENLKNNHSEISVNEARWVKQYYEEYYGATPSEDPESFMDLSPFSIDTIYGSHEQYLGQVAVRAYHDIDVAWRLENRNQTPQYDNYVATATLINRLMLSGNSKAEFIQSYQTGYRRNGNRHPHSWSIVDEEECMDWVDKMLH